MHVIGHIDRGPQWKPGRTVIAQGAPMALHLQYMKNLYDQGVLLLGGPYESQEMGGLAVFFVDNMATAERLAGDDPAARAGVIVYRLTELRTVFDRASGLDRAKPLADAFDVMRDRELLAKVGP